MYTYIDYSSQFTRGKVDIIETPLENDNYINIIGTRFFVENNATKKFFEKFLSDDDAIYDYLKKRCKLFYEVCYNQVIKQMSKKDKWLLFATTKYIDFLKKLLQIDDKRVILCAPEIPNIVRIINEEIHKNNIVIFTRIDNDDTLQKEYLKLLKKIVNYIAVNKKYDDGMILFPVGLKRILDNNRIFLYIFNRTHTNSVFYSKEISEELIKKKGFFLSHTLIFDKDYNHHNVFIVNTNLPMWIENIHDSNQINKFLPAAIEVKNSSLLDDLFEISSSKK